jgi:hypothetical protein
MILKGSQRGGGLQLASHLLNEQDNDHVTLHEVRGFMAEDLHGELAEAYAVSKGTKCEQFMFSLSLNPPKDAECSLEVMIEAADRAEDRLGLKRQPRAVVVHEKEGRRHIHVVWSRIDASTMKAVELPFFKNKLASLSRELYLEHEWTLPEGHRENGWKNPLNFTLAEWQQCKRIGLDPREVRQAFQDAWKHSDGAKSFRPALEDRGYYLAAGDRRGFVAVDLNGEVFAVSRMCGVKAKDLAARLGSPGDLPSVEEVKDRNTRLLRGSIEGLLKESRREQREALKPLVAERKALVVAQRGERRDLNRKQDARWRQETAERQSRFRKGVRGLWDIVTGRAASIRHDNEREAMDSQKRDLAQREALFEAQMQERRELQERIDALRAEQRAQRVETTGQIAFLLDLEGFSHGVTNLPRRRHEPSLDL